MKSNNKLRGNKITIDLKELCVLRDLMKKGLAHETAKFELDKRTMELSHQQAVSIHNCTLIQKEFTIEHEDEQIISLKSELKRLQTKSSKHDEVSAQGVKSLIQLQIFEKRQMRGKYLYVCVNHKLFHLLLLFY